MYPSLVCLMAKFNNGGYASQRYEHEVPCYLCVPIVHALYDNQLCGILPNVILMSTEKRKFT